MELLTLKRWNNNENWKPLKLNAIFKLMCNWFINGSVFSFQIVNHKTNRLIHLSRTNTEFTEMMGFVVEAVNLRRWMDVALWTRIPFSIESKWFFVAGAIIIVGQESFQHNSSERFVSSSLYVIITLVFSCLLLQFDTWISRRRGMTFLIRFNRGFKGFCGASSLYAYCLFEAFIRKHRRPFSLTWIWETFVIHISIN